MDVSCSFDVEELWTLSYAVESLDSIPNNSTQDELRE
jgi:hypothetical protein